MAFYSLYTFLSLSLLLLHSHGSPFESEEGIKRFTGAQVHRLTVTTMDKFEGLINLYEWGILDFWSRPSINDFTDIMVYPEQNDWFQQQLERLDIQSTLFIEDVEKVVEGQRQAQKNARRNRPTDGLATKMNWSRYYSLDEIYYWLEDLASTYPDLCTLRKIGESHEGRNIYAMQITAKSEDQRPIMFMDGGIHAREWISPAVVCYTINELLTRRRDMLNAAEYWFIPCMNPDGYEYTWTVNRLWRKNRSFNTENCTGTDLNRNFGYMWGGPGASPDCCSEIYRGTSAFSEPETTAVAELFKEVNVNGQIMHYCTLHSYGQFWFIPWGWTDENTADYDEQMKMANMAKEIIHERSGSNYTAGSSTALLYPAAGGSDDWTYGECKVVHSNCVELRDLGEHGFLLPEDKIAETGDEFCAAFFAVGQEIVKTWNGGRGAVVGR